MIIARLVETQLSLVQWSEMFLWGIWRRSLQKRWSFHVAVWPASLFPFPPLPAHLRMVITQLWMRSFFTLIVFPIVWETSLPPIHISYVDLNINISAYVFFGRVLYFFWCSFELWVIWKSTSCCCNLYVAIICLSNMKWIVIRIVNTLIVIHEIIVMLWTLL